MRRQRKVLDRKDLSSMRTWSIIMAILWLGSAALSISETGNRAGIAAWGATVMSLGFVGAAVHYQNRLERLGEDAPMVPDRDGGPGHAGGDGG